MKAVVLLSSLLVLPSTTYAHFIDATVCSDMQNMCFDIGHGSSDQGVFRFLSPSNPHYDMEAYLSRSLLIEPGWLRYPSLVLKLLIDNDLEEMNSEERLRMKINVKRPLYMLLKPLLEGPNVTSVEIDPAMAQIAKKYFGVVEDQFYRILINDGMDVLKTNVKGLNETKWRWKCDLEKREFDAVILDACSGNIFDEVVCPSSAFLSQEAVELMYGNVKMGGSLSIGILMGQDSHFGRTIIQVNSLESQDLVWISVCEESSRYIQKSMPCSRDQWGP
uniref:Methyltransf_11 domain-containing protein n=1 Tax=Steinernema glaseri TaxID=37863 RepID=A0A1I7ZGC1_9BILA